MANAAATQADAQKRNIATSGTARGGGVNAVGQQIDTNKNANIDTALNQAIAGAAPGAAGVGSTEAGLGTNLFGIANNAAAETLKGSIESRPTSYGIHNDTADTFGNLISDLLNPPGAGGQTGGGTVV